MAGPDLEAGRCPAVLSKSLPDDDVRNQGYDDNRKRHAKREEDGFPLIVTANPDLGNHEWQCDQRQDGAGSQCIQEDSSHASNDINS